MKGIKVEQTNHQFEDAKKALYQSLREAIASGKSVRDVVDLIYKFYDNEPGTHHVASTMLALQKAFGLGFFDVKPIAEAQCTGNYGYSDEEIDRILRPVLLDALKRLDSPTEESKPAESH